MQVLMWVIGLPLGLFIFTRGWTPPKAGSWSWLLRDKEAGKPLFPDDPPSAAPSTSDLIAGFHERIATNAELTRAAAAADQASAVACRKCGRNHFAGCPDDEPDAGARAVNGRTGELAGYWSPRED